MLNMSYEQARALCELLNRIDDDEEGAVTISKPGVGADLKVVMEDGEFEITGGGTTERIW